MIRIVGAFVGHVFSYLTTLAFALHLIRPQDGPTWALAIAVALAGEAFFYAMKETLWDANTANNPVGWVGIVLDGIVNTGGILPWAPRVLTFGPISLSLGMLGVNVADPFVAAVGSVIISVIAGFVLSVAPHLLWHWKRKK